AADLRGELKRLKRESGSGTSIHSSGHASAAVAAPPERKRTRWLWPVVGTAAGAGGTGAATALPATDLQRPRGGRGDLARRQVPRPCRPGAAGHIAASAFDFERQ